ncbi:MAG: hypothetical protein ACXAD7_07855 [Candidatus Kariarchaeaceae archaeon]|jgi:hypothetical protein
MSIYCEVCGNSNVKREFTVMKGGGFKKPIFYCSKKCRDKDLAHYKTRGGYILIFIGVLFSASLAPVLTVVGLGSIVGGGILLYVGKKHSLINVTRWDAQQKLSRNPQNDQTAIAVQSAKTIYVEELERNIPICCYQTARLREKYCKCGKAVPDFSISY